MSVRFVSTERRQVSAAIMKRKSRGFTVCAVKNNLGILVVVFIPKRIRLELPFLFCGGHFRKQMYSICMCFQDYYYAGYVVCFVSVYTISCCLPCRVGI